MLFHTVNRSYTTRFVCGLLKTTLTCLPILFLSGCDPKDYPKVSQERIEFLKEVRARPSMHSEPAHFSMSPSVFGGMPEDYEPPKRPKPIHRKRKHYVQRPLQF